ncbi:MAG: glycosyltransferase, partial [Oleiphilaceae bacterium]|nr:glycosyltransferase [Oleiphilaceae bacterium]
FQAYSRFYRLGWLEKLILAYLRFFHNRTLKTLVPTSKQRNWLEGHGFKRVSVLQRGIDRQLFKPERRSAELRASWGVTDNETPVCLYVGRIANEKNVQLVGQTYAQLQSEFPELKLVMVGDGPARAGLEKQYPEILFAGMKTGEALAEHYASADIFLFPSQTDTFGNVVLEAIASRLAVVAFNDAAANEILSHEKDALLAEFGDDAAFSNHVRRLLENPTLLDSIRRTAHHRAESLGWDAIVEQFAHHLLDRDYTGGTNHALQQDIRTH